MKRRIKACLLSRVLVGLVGFMVVMAALMTRETQAAGLFRKKSRVSQDKAYVTPEMLRGAVASAASGYMGFISDVVRDYGVNVVDEAGRSLLHYASGMGGGASVVSFLTAQRADVNKVDGNGDTPLIFAVRSNNGDAVRALIDAKVDMEHVNKNGDTALEIAMQRRYTDIAQELIARGAFVNPQLLPAG